MTTKIWNLLALAIVLPLSSCGFTQLERYPETWSAVTREKCPNLSGTYSFLGNFSPEEQKADSANPEFNSWALSKNISAQLGENDYVDLSQNVKSGVTHIRFFRKNGELVDEMIDHIQCKKEGYLKEKYSDSPGEGISGTSRTETRLYVTTDGSLVVYIRTVTDAKTLFVLPASGITQSWVKFRRIPAPKNELNQRLE